MDYLNFSDMCVKYSTFLDDVAARVVHLLKQDANDPEFISQNKAFEMFGRGNVERWRKQGKVKQPTSVRARSNTEQPTCGSCSGYSKIILASSLNCRR